MICTAPARPKFGPQKVKKTTPYLSHIYPNHGDPLFNPAMLEREEFARWQCGRFVAAIRDSPFPIPRSFKSHEKSATGVPTSAAATCHIISVTRV